MGLHPGWEPETFSACLQGRPEGGSKVQLTVTLGTYHTVQNRSSCVHLVQMLELPNLAVHKIYTQGTL